ncbi:MAG: transposase [Chromatiaceae bacterium]|nr:transposase [Chromatiaceae bacterium]
MTQLREAMIDAMLLRGFSPRTHQSYLSAVVGLVRYYHRPPDQISEPEIQRYFLYLVKERQLSPASCRLILNGLVFLYRQVLERPFSIALTLPKRPQRIPELLTREEVAAILAACTHHKRRMLLTLCYGCGLRLNELVHLQVSDIDGERCLLRIDQGKGHKDRLVEMSATLLVQLRDYWRALRPLQWLFPGRDSGMPLCANTPQKYYTEAKRQAWSERQQSRVLPVTYYHQVITLPHQLNGWVGLHPKKIYQLFFRVVWGTLKAFGEDPKRLGGQLGVVAVLHTWGQQLWRHVHLHCLIPGGALDHEGRWHAARSTYLFPDRAVARVVRGRMVSELRQAWKRGELSRITRAGEVDELLDRLMKIDWVVYTKPWLRNPETVLAYLSRYTHRTAISDARIGELTDGEVAVAYKDYQDRDRWKKMTLKGEELIRRFLLHVLPKGLMRIRHYGFLANRCRREKLAQIREILGGAGAESVEERGEAEAHSPQWPCPKCHQGHLRPSQMLAPVRLDGA